jgi:4'-phosphopantetheinyl transferase EntD
MIAELLPGDVVSADTTGDEVDMPLYADEEALLAHAVDKRRREFTTVRVLARRLLDELGFAPAPILRDERGAPIWPHGVVGSMTHCDGFRAVAVARAASVPTIGIDAEPALALPAGVLGLVSLPEERDALARLALREPAVAWDRLLFCAKEAVYKAWYPLAGRWLGFEEARITLNPIGTFTAALLVPGPWVDGQVVAGFDGRWMCRDGLLVTAIAGRHR